MADKKGGTAKTFRKTDKLAAGGCKNKRKAPACLYGMFHTCAGVNLRARPWLPGWKPEFITPAQV